ncbi:MAG: ketoacyl-ACP synthase III [Puniceicoccales bacterium]|jgi:3-oxoacyl-[acyl-carrier-protein] synthase-3|nr:ketoacyl-ACP synthase III [Puniceicoccales bacterium]
MQQGSVIIRGVGSYLPRKILTNHDLASMVDTSDEWIRTRTGISQRHIADAHETCSDLAYVAAKSALENAQLKAQDIDLLVVATMTPDMICPSLAAILQAKLGLRKVMSFDINAACSGFLYALEVATRLLQNGNFYKRALVIGAEKMSSLIDWEDRSTCVLFGDAAGASVLEHTSTEQVGILDAILRADGSFSPGILYIPAGGSLHPATTDTVTQRQHFIKMNGRELFKTSVRLMGKVIEELLERNHLTKADIACLIPHQANLRIIQSLAQSIGLSMDRVFCNLEVTGNTSSASIPVAFTQAKSAHYFRSGDYIVLVAFGGGLTWGATLIKW